MKKGIFVSILSCLFFQSCFVETERVVENYYSSLYEPVVMDRENFEQSLAFKEPQPMQHAGKIYVKDSYVFIVDKNKGIHIYKNMENYQLNEISYFEVPGATDIAIRNQIFYINQATDLIAVKMNVAQQTFEVTKRVKNIFPAKISPDGYVFDVSENKVVVDWKSIR